MSIDALASSSETYTGSAIALPTPVVKANGTELTSGVDYTGVWTASNGSTVTGTVTNADTYTFTVTSLNANKYSGSPTVTFKVNPLKLTAPTLTTAAADSATQITVTAVAGALPTGAEKVQYSKDGGAWQDSNVFTGLDAATEYTFTAKYVANSSGNYTDSDASGGVTAITLAAPTYGVAVAADGGNAYTGLTYGEAPAAKTITITNNGNTQQTINVEISDTTNFTLSAASVADVAATGTGTVTVTPKANLNAGDYSVTLTATSAQDTNEKATVTLTLKVDQKTLTVTWDTMVFADMVYNGKGKTDVAAPTSGAPTLSDGATPVVTYTRATSDKGDSVTVNAEITGFTGASTTNYKLPTTGLTNDTGRVKVTAKAITLDTTGITVNAKTYDGSDAAALNKLPTLTGVIEGDTVTVALNATGAKFDTADAGAGTKTVTATYELGGAQAGNYTLTDATLTLNNQTISPATITGAPTIAWGATGAAGDTITLAKGSLSVELSAVDVEWLRDGAAISGETGTTYTIDTADVGKSITAKVTAKANGNYTGSVTSNALEPGKTQLTGTPTISGATGVGDTLTLDVSPLNAAASATDVSNLDIQWYRGSDIISGATELTYVITSADLGKDIKAVVTAKSASTYTGTAATAATSIPATVPGAPKDVQAAGDGQLTVTWKAPDSDGGSPITKYIVQIGSEALVDVAGSLSHTFTGLANGTEYTIKVIAVNAEGNSAPATITAKPAAAPVGGGGGGAVNSYTVTYKAGENGTLVDENDKTVSKLTETVKKGETPENVPEVKADEGYKFLGWSTDGGKTFVDPAKADVTKGVTYTAIFGVIETPDHLTYMNGYSATEFRPNGNLTRAEAAAMLSRLFQGFSEDGGYTGATFTDVEESFWGYKYISFAEANGLVTGYKDGSFAPDQTITRAEFAALLARFVGIASIDAAAGYSDTQGHWAEGYIAALAEAGILDGYPDGSFRPDQTITRAEAAKAVNGAIGRAPNADIDLIAAGYQNLFADVRESDWFFHDVMEATVDHIAQDFHGEK